MEIVWACTFITFIFFAYWLIKWPRQLKEKFLFKDCSDLGGKFTTLIAYTYAIGAAAFVILIVTAIVTHG